ncbi:MAG: 2-C-methyl-D-erythritol 4-phosphate cytidylyltransferase [Acidobacteriota bacterium]|nr:MAG: 2-C-methyl-D-erythritol 4-phosphate cytidylyltransferase [Acidobacteriota bacterium]
MNSAIIVAAGSGQRFGSEIPKQFVPILGKPLIARTLERFTECDAIDEIVLVLSEDGERVFAEMPLDLPGLKIVHGGETRARSVRNGLDAVDAASRVVAVHDGARPLVTVDEIAKTVRAAERTGAACLVAAVSDTIKSIRGNEITATLNRTQLRRALTPQAFHVEVLRKAFENIELDDRVTDECYLVEKLGHPITIVEGSSRNIKVTHPEDILFAEAVLTSGTI